VNLTVGTTPTGQRSIETLRGKARKAFDAAVERIASEGCQACDYRLTGDGVEHICSIQLYGRYRALVCFPDDESAVVLIVGEHLRDDPATDVYRSLYRLLELSEPSGKRTKPPCCDESGKAPIDPELLDRFQEGAAQLRRPRRRSSRPTPSPG
jgi:hypothetical protein